MPFSLLFPSHTRLRYHLLHDICAVLLNVGDLVLSALLLHFFFSSSYIVYFVTALSLIFLALLCFTVFHLYAFTSLSLPGLLLFVPVSFLSPFLILPTYYAFPSSVPSWLLRLLHSRPPLQPAEHADPTRSYILYKRAQHAGFHLHAVVFTLPVSVVNLVFCCSHPHEVSALQQAALLVSVAVLCSRILGYSVHAPTMAVMLSCVAMDIVNLYCWPLLLASSTPALLASAPSFSPFFFPSYSHASPLNSFMLCKDFVLLLAASFTLLVHLLSLSLRDLHFYPPRSLRGVLAHLLRYWIVLIGSVAVFVPALLVLKAVNCCWAVLLLLAVSCHQHWRHPVFYRRLWRFLSARTEERDERLFLAHQFMAGKALALYPPPVCNTARRRGFVSAALHTLALTPASFHLPTVKRMAAHDPSSPYSSSFLTFLHSLSLIRQHFFTGLPSPPPPRPLHAVLSSIVGHLCFHLLLPLYLLSVAFDVLFPLAEGAWLAAEQGWTQGGGASQLALLACAAYSALLLLILLLLPALLRFHRLMSRLTLYDLPDRAEDLQKMHKERRGDDDDYDDDEDQDDEDEQRDADDGQLRLCDDNLDDWPLQLSALLYSSRQREEAQRVLQAEGLAQDVIGVVLSYLPVMEMNRRDGQQEAEEEQESTAEQQHREKEEEKEEVTDGSGAAEEAAEEKGDEAGGDSMVRMSSDDWRERRRERLLAEQQPHCRLWRTAQQQQQAGFTIDIELGERRRHQPELTDSKHEDEQAAAALQQTAEEDASVVRLQIWPERTDEQQDEQEESKHGEGEEEETEEKTVEVKHEQSAGKWPGFGTSAFSLLAAEEKTAEDGREREGRGAERSARRGSATRSLTAYQQMEEQSSSGPTD